MTRVFIRRLDALDAGDGRFQHEGAKSPSNIEADGDSGYLLTPAAMARPFGATISVICRHVHFH